MKIEAPTPECFVTDWKLFGRPRNRFQSASYPRAHHPRKDDSHDDKTLCGGGCAPRHRLGLTTGPHSPGFIRAWAPLRNIDAWYEAFGVKEGDKLYVKPEDRVRIW